MINLGAQALDGAGARRSTTMGRLHKVNVEVVVRQHGATYRGDAHHVVLDAHLFNDLGDDSVNHTMAAARAVVHDVVGEDRRASVH